MYYVTCHTKRGRPKSLYPSIDSGTLEIKQKRNTLINQAYHKKTEYSHSLLSLLYAYQKITRGMFEAGLFLQHLKYQSATLSSLTPFSRKSSVVYSIATRSSYSFELSSKTSFAVSNAQKKWRQAERILQKQGEQSCKDIKKIIIDNELPAHWLQQDQVNFKPLQIGLKAIEKEFFYSKA